MTRTLIKAATVAALGLTVAAPAFALTNVFPTFVTVPDTTIPAPADIKGDKQK
ncbi:hypothetical protein [uncultured Tateyamaria sp.]|uniref:hypothetical protein n=1 Tax=uncultured Tateyamaria sp. TaxID=455651 RepID=UPI0026017791|nr:hypothetical protein [uncultured Tateyamaria sp.]